MPNGGMSRGYFEALERFFAPLSESIETFAARHNLLIDRYYHEAPSWSLCFSHPRGGSVKIEIARASEGGIDVQAIWWLDVHREFTRYLRDGERRHCEASTAALAPELARALSEALSWRAGEWTRVARGYKDAWGGYTADEFARLGPHYPAPVP